VVSAHPRDPRIIVSAGYDGKVCIWDVVSGRLVSSFHEGSNKISDGQISPCGQYIALCDKDGFFSLYGSGNDALVKKVCALCFRYWYHSNALLTL